MSFGKLIFGALLVGIGGILLASHLGYVPAGTAAWLLHYWPVLLIAIGLAFLASAIKNPFLGWIAAIVVIAGLAIGAWWAHENGAPSAKAVETSYDLDRPLVQSVTMRTRTLGGAFTVEEGGTARRLRVRIEGAGDQAEETAQYTPTKGGALLSWPSRGTHVYDAPPGAQVHVRAPNRLAVRIEARSLFSSTDVDLSKLRSDRCSFDATVSRLRVDLRGPAHPATIHVKGFLATTELLLPASGPVRIEFTSRLTTRSLPEDFMEHAAGRARSKTKIWTSEGTGAPLVIRIDGPFMHLKITREAAKAV